MTIDEVVQIMIALAGEQGKDKQVTPGQMTNLLWVANIAHFKQKMGLPEEYQPGTPLTKEIIELTKKIKEDLRPFLVERGIKDNAGIPVDGDGFAQIPADYYIVSTVSYHIAQKGGEKKRRDVEVVTDVDWNDRVNSYIIHPTMRYPICNFQKDYIRVMPTGVSYLRMIYYRLPKKPVYATKSGFYDAENSVDLEWDDINQVDIIYKALSLLGIPLQREDILQVNEMRKKQGT